MGERRLVGRQQPGGLVEEAMGEGGKQLLEGGWHLCIGKQHMINVFVEMTTRK